MMVIKFIGQRKKTVLGDKIPAKVIMFRIRHSYIQQHKNMRNYTIKIIDNTKRNE